MLAAFLLVLSITSGSRRIDDTPDKNKHNNGSYEKTSAIAGPGFFKNEPVKKIATPFDAVNKSGYHEKIHPSCCPEMAAFPNLFAMADKFPRWSKSTFY
ncbi:MAG: hypothetical protein MUD12_09290 [Spirochaetes bacterium]|nr:hypothetical protein [Spirochaetota bacterium]